MVFLSLLYLTRDLYDKTHDPEPLKTAANAAIKEDFEEYQQEDFEEYQRGAKKRFGTIS